MATQTELIIESLDPLFQQSEMNQDLTLSDSYIQQESPAKESSDSSDPNMLRKFSLLNRLGMGPRTANSLSKDSIKKMSFLYEAERKDSIEEEELMVDDLEIQSSYENAEGDFSLNLFQRTDDEIRKAYLNRLISMKILKLNPSRKHQEAIILDWDDTLLPTTYLERSGFVNLPQETMDSMKVLDEKIYTFLETALTFGDTFIVTNAQPRWVAYTGMLFLPKSYELIKAKIEVISARANYEEAFPGDNYRWKLETFLDLKAKFDAGTVANIMCIGDSRIEMEAARSLGEQFAQSLVKTVKFKSSPGISDLIKQIGLLNDRFEQICVARTNLTIKLEKKN